MSRVLWLVVVLTPIACSRSRTVACHTPDLMCHEWLEASDSLVEQVRGPICHGSDEQFIDGPCIRDNVFGVCTTGKERTVWYRVDRHQFDGSKACANGTWSAGP